VFLCFYADDGCHFNQFRFPAIAAPPPRVFFGATELAGFPPTNAVQLVIRKKRGEVTAG
jgi:hypothetical protein